MPKESLLHLHWIYLVLAILFEVAGSICMKFRDNQVWIEEGELMIVPRGVEHRPASRRISWTGQVLGHDKQRMIRLLSRCLGGQIENWDSRFVKILDDLDFIFIRFEPETAVVRDQSYQIKGAAEPC